jgi:inosine-uridine nucleoside N-ribohydrolase
MSSASSSPSSSSPIWLDCDPGHDDFFALLLAAASPPSRLTGVSTVHGNQSVAKTTHNALVALHVARLVPGTVPVLAGSASALLGAAGAACPEVHGESGLDCGVPLPQPTQRAESTDNFLLHWRNALLASKDKVALVATGALTNVALLLLAFPEVKANLASITVLGGAWGVGNMSPDAEWNIMVDPHAALVVFNVSGVDVRLITIDVTHTNLVTPARLRQVADAVGADPRNASLNEILQALLLFFASTYAREFAMPDPPLHDPLAVAAVLAPHVFKFTKRRVDVETNASSHCVGRTSIDMFSRSKLPANVFVCDSANIDEFWNLMCAAIHEISQRQ